MGGRVTHIGQTAVIFVSARTRGDAEGYAAAAAMMEEQVVLQPGYCGSHSARGPDGVGITVSYWKDDAAARAWRAHAEHGAVRAQGRARWYDWYKIIVATVTREHGWTGA